MILERNINCGCTHAGKFHADDVFATALLQLLNPEFTWIRVVKVPEDFDGIVYDIGGGEFDHHQKDNEVRENGIPYAAFGKLWRAFGSALVATERGFNAIDSKLVQSIDETDNTGSFNTLSAAISALNPSWNSEKSADEKFAEAVALAKTILSSYIERENSIDDATEIVETAISSAANDEIVVLPQFVPSMELLVPSNAKFFIFPSNRGGYNVQVVPRELGNREAGAKIDLPESWAGVPADELAEISGIEGMTFCHAARFLCSASSFEGAVKAAVTALSGEQSYCSSFNAEVESIVRGFESAY